MFKSPNFSYFTFNTNRPNVVLGQNPIAFSGGRFDPAKDVYWNAARWSQPAPFTFGNAPKFDDRARGFATYNENFSLVKRTYITESINIEFRAEAFNLFNRTVFGSPSGNYNNPVAFGRVGGQATTPRKIQFGLKFNW